MKYCDYISGIISIFWTLTVALYCVGKLSMKFTIAGEAYRVISSKVSFLWEGICLSVVRIFTIYVCERGGVCLVRRLSFVHTFDFSERSLR